MNIENLPALLKRLPEAVKEYDEKLAAIPEEVERFKATCTALETASCVGGTFGASIWYRSSPSLDASDMESALLKSAWKNVYYGLNINLIATAADRKKFDLAIENPPEFTFDNVRATFGTYVQDPYSHILRGLAECFCQLDDAYKSHSKVKIGVKGLPKRVIISNVGSWGSWGYARVRDTLNALSVYRGKPHLKDGEIDDLIKAAGKGDKATHDGVTLRKYMNGNGHLIFDQDALRDINLALAEFYGDTLPDSPEEAARKQPGTGVAKNLAYYPTPVAVVEKILATLHIREGEHVLEPQCGCGRFLDGILQVAPKAKVTGVEYHLGRVEEARSKGHSVLAANFLQTAPDPRFDRVIMNPPFNGREWRKHLDHARKFLKPNLPGETPGGSLISILPASAYYDGHLDDLAPSSPWADFWKDLPVGSFSESGTNIPTGYVQLGPLT